MKLKIRAILGLSLMIISIISFYWWENYGREKLMFDKVIVSKVELNQGDVINENKIAEKVILPENKVKNGMSSVDIEKIRNKKIKTYIPQGSQIVKEMFSEENEIIKENGSFFRIPKEWIGSSSSSLRKNDNIEILNLKTKSSLGKYKVAHVKDSEECEITNENGTIEARAIERDDNSAVINFIEIIATLKEFSELEKVVNEGSQLLIIQREISK